MLETDTKGTGARVVPLEDALQKPEAPEPFPAAQRPAGRPNRRSRRKQEVRRWATPLPTGHVRKKATGEIGRVKAVDAKAGTATVTWLRQGRTSTVPLSSIARS